METGENKERKVKEKGGKVITKVGKKEDGWGFKKEKWKMKNKIKLRNIKPGKKKK